MGSNRVEPSACHKGVAEGGVDEEYIADVVEEEEAVEVTRDVTMAETDTAPRIATHSDTANEMGALATND